jgi:hypothetical protein
VLLVAVVVVVVLVAFVVVVVVRRIVILGGRCCSGRGICTHGGPFHRKAIVVVPWRLRRHDSFDFCSSAVLVLDYRRSISRGPTTQTVFLRDTAVKRNLTYSHSLTKMQRWIFVWPQRGLFVQIDYHQIKVQ